MYFVKVPADSSSHKFSPNWGMHCLWECDTTHGQLWLFLEVLLVCQLRLTHCLRSAASASVWGRGMHTLTQTLAFLFSFCLLLLCLQCIVPWLFCCSSSRPNANALRCLNTEILLVSSECLFQHTHTRTPAHVHSLARTHSYNIWQSTRSAASLGKSLTVLYNSALVSV